MIAVLMRHLGMVGLVQTDGKFKTKTYCFINPFSQRIRKSEVKALIFA